MKPNWKLAAKEYKRAFDQIFEAYQDLGRVWHEDCTRLEQYAKLWKMCAKRHKKQHNKYPDNKKWLIQNYNHAEDWWDVIGEYKSLEESFQIIRSNPNAVGIRMLEMIKSIHNKHSK